MHYRNLWRRTLIVCTLAAGLAPPAALAQPRTALDDARNRMVNEEIVGGGVKNKRVIEAMRNTPRHEFVPAAHRKQAYYDMALPIGESQTISPPFVVAYMTESLDPQPTDKVLEIGTGSGYQAAVLSPLVRDVYTIEIVAPLGHAAAKVLKKLKYNNVHAKVGDGFLGWPENAPFDKIIVTCSPEKVPQPLIDQLKEGGRIVIPVGERYQQTLYLMKKVDGKLTTEALQPTLFVPMTGKAESGREVKPDPAHPSIGNGDFEKTIGNPPFLVGWHYQRQMEVVTAADAPQGKNYITFRNADPGRGSHALQGLPVDGRKVSKIEVSLRVHGENIRPGQTPQQMPAVVFTFYDENRATVGQAAMGDWRGSFPWQKESKRIDVPNRAREAVLRIGLLGAVGSISFDDIVVQAAGK
jgi:protein-L-isoaspartate(D-aspartate) O-methyltransferase